MRVCDHLPFECIQVSCQGINNCITNFNHLTSVSDIINALLDDLSNGQYFSINDCCLYVQDQSYLYPLKSTDLIQDIFCRCSSSDIHFKLIFKRNSSPSRFAEHKKVFREKNPYEQLRMQELLIQKQQEIIHQLTKTNERQSRHDAVNRSFSRVRFRLPSISRKKEIISDVKSILKRSSSVDRNIDQLISLKPGENSFCISDDDNLSEQSTTDSCLGSISSNDSAYHSINQHHLETLV